MKKIVSNFCVSVLCIVVNFSVQAQDQFKCGSDLKMAEVYKAYPGLEADQQKLLENSRSYSMNERGEREEVYIIPVVFHVIHEYGAENISDAQIYDQMAILNRDFRKLNPDTVEIMNEFKAIAADTKIEFKLASLDPFGNCTNGIEHINSHETNVGDDPSKLNQWPRSKYLNVWIVKSMENGVAGYAYYPSAVTGGFFYADGIIIRHNYIGSIGTGSVFNSRALTHEIGHWLGLPHVWGSTNEPGVACGDDNIHDTPPTAGHTTCVLVGTDNCQADTAENIQNYMEYSYCSRMYTEGQAAVMNLVLEDIVSSRKNLWSDLNHTITGIDVTAPLCSPVADFYANKELICIGQTVSYTSTTWRAPVDSYSWYFPGGTPEFSSDPSPTVTYNNAGYHTVTLTVTNAAGTDTKSVESAIAVQGDWWEYLGPHSESFESGSFEPHWISINPEDDETTFEVHENVGYSGNHAAGVIFYKSNLDPILDLNYLERIGGSKEILITPVFNLDNTTNASLSFKYAHASTSSGLFEAEDLNLKVFYSINCGATWVTLQNIQDIEVLTAGYQGNNFYPTDPVYWYSVSVGLPAVALQSQVRFKFEFTATDYSNNFFLDDINVNGVLLTQENTLEITDVSVFPNPVASASIMSIGFSLLQAENVTLVVHDIVGNIVSSSAFLGNQGVNKFELPLMDYNLSEGSYSVSIITDSGMETVKLIIN